MYIGTHNNSATNLPNTNNNTIVTILSFLFISGVYFPTSIGGILNKNFTLFITIATALVFLLIMILMIRTNPFFLGSLFIINIVLWLSTLLNSPGIIEKSAAVFFFLITLMYCLSLEEIKPNKAVLKAFNFVNIVTIVVGFCMVFSFYPVGNVFINYYTDFFPELVIYMLERGKPVITFATHSIAGFYLFVFSYLNHKAYKALNKKVYLLFSFIYLYFCLELQSNTSLFFLALGLLVIFWGVKQKLFFIAKISLPVLLVFFLFKDGIFDYWHTIWFDINRTTSSEGSGLLGRYVDGNQSTNINYLLSNPFSPVGFSSDNQDLVMYDSGIIVTTLRGTILLTAIVYFCLFAFLRKNLVNKKTASFLFTIIFAFELGFNNLYYFRTIMMLPFIIIFLNYLENEVKQKKMSHSISFKSQ